MASLVDPSTPDGSATGDWDRGGSVEPFRMAVGVWFDAMLPQSRRPGLTWPASPTDAAGRPIEGDGSKLAAARGAPTSCDDRTCKAPIDTVRPRRGTTRSPEPSGVLDSPWRGLVRAPSTPGSSQALACSAAVTGKRHSRASPEEACGAGGADAGAAPAAGRCARPRKAPEPPWSQALES